MPPPDPIKDGSALDPTWSGGPPPWCQVGPDRAWVFDRQSSRAVDLAAMERFGIPGIVLMENASRGLAEAAIGMIRELARPGAAPGQAPGPVDIVCGRGNNGGDGYALARHLHNAEIPVRLVSLGEPRPETDAGLNHDVCRRMKICFIDADEWSRGAGAEAGRGLVVDAIFGTGLDRAIEGLGAEVVHAINASGRPVLAVDVPSGLDCDTGRPLGPTVRATRTVTFVGLKRGFLEASAEEFLGRVTVADIGAPLELLREFGQVLPEGPMSRESR